MLFHIFIGMEENGITYDYCFNVLESLKDSYHEGEEMITMIDFCHELISHPKLKVYPYIEIHQHTILFNYENSMNHLVIKIESYGFNYDDKILSYFWVKGEQTQTNDAASWNQVLDVIWNWYK